MAFGFGDSSLDFVIFLEVAILLFLLFRGSLRGIAALGRPPSPLPRDVAEFVEQSPPPVSERQDGPQEAEGGRDEKPASEVEILYAKRQEILDVLQEMRRKYASGGMDYSEYARSAPKFEFELVKVDSLLSRYFADAEKEAISVEAVVSRVIVNALCVRCRARRVMSKARRFVMRNGRKAYKGYCPACGSPMFKIVSHHVPRFEGDDA